MEDFIVANRIAIFGLGLLILLLIVIHATYCHWRNSKRDLCKDEKIKEKDEKIEGLLKKVEALEELSTIDSLTGLKNRRSFDETLDSFLSLLPFKDELPSKDHERPGKIHGLGLLMIDIDHFKLINDTHGHLVGDRFLKGVAASISKCFRSTDLIGRFGGEEFMVAIPAVTSDDLKQTAEKLREFISASLLENERVVVTVSIGALHTTYHQQAKVLVDMADKALYVAKGTGRNRVITYLLN